MLVPASILLPAQAQEEPELVVSTSLGGSQDIPLKAIKDSDDNIDTQNDFEIEPQNVISVEQGQSFHVLVSDGSLIAVKATNPQRITTDLEFSQADGRVTQNLPSNPYLLDVIVEMDNDDRFLYETVLAILAPGQTINQINTQNIIQNFVSTASESHTTIVLEDDSDDNGNEPDREEICRFTPSHPICAPNEDGECGEGFAMNEDGQCFPRGDCPDGYHRPNDDESGACISEEKLDQCQDGSWKYPADGCYGEDPTPTPALEEEITAETPPTPEPEEEPLDSNCGGVPCTASEKEDSWTSDVPESSPGVPITDSEEPEAEETESETE